MSTITPEDEWNVVVRGGKHPHQKSRMEVRTFCKADDIARGVYWTTEERVVDIYQSTNVKFPVGTVFTCEQGHPVCEAVESIRFYQLIQTSLFGNYSENQKRVPEKGFFGAKCYCGSHWARSDMDGLRAQLHTKDGWS